MSAGSCGPHDEAGQFIQAVTDCIRREGQFLDRLFHAIDPEGGITECFRAGSIPAREGAKHDLVAPQVQGIHGHVVRARVGFKYTHPVGTEVRLEQTLQSATVHRRRQHRRSEVRKQDQPDTGRLEPLQARRVHRAKA